MPRRLVISRRAILAWAAAAVGAAEPAAAQMRARSFVADLDEHAITLHWQDDAGRPYRNLRALHRDLVARGEKVLCLTNAGIYGRDFAPLGLHVEAGEVLRPLNRSSGGGNFFLKPNGVFGIRRGTAFVEDAAGFEAGADLRLATQSGPLLFDRRGIHPRFLPASTSRFIRNGVGVRDDGRVVFAISDEPVRFFDFALLMRDGLGCRSALYLDGSISQMWLADGPAPWFGPERFVGMLAVTARSADDG